MRSRGFIVKVPKGTQANRLTRAEANESRFATKTRFVVEVRTSHIKNIWKHLSGTKIHQYIPHLKKDFEVCAALVNAFCRSIESDKNDWANIGDLMLNRLNQLNPLQTIVSRIPNGAFRNVLNLTLFPKFSYADLKQISQIRQAASYCHSHVKANNGAFMTKVCDANVNPLILSIDLKSRFQSNHFHKAYVLLSLDLHQKYVVNKFCCSCRHGCRTVGCCSHVMLLIWYTLYIDPNQVNSLFPSSNFDKIFDKWNNEYSDDSSDTDYSVSETDSFVTFSSGIDSD